MPENRESEPRQSAGQVDRVSWNQLIAYGMGGMIPIALFNIAGQLISLLGNISLGLSAFWLGAILMVPRLWDAVSDPIVGYLSDNTRTAWGRRRPFILAGGIAVAVSFVVMWWVPEEETLAFLGDDASHWLRLLFILMTVLAFYTACTLFEIPHGALGMEMTNDHHERTRLFSAKAFFGNLFAMGTPFLLKLASLDAFKGTGDQVDGMRYVSLLIALVLVPLSVWWFFSLREPGFAKAKQQERTPFWTEMSSTLSNRVFLSLVVTIFTLAMGFNFVQLFNYYMIIFYLYGGDEIAAADLLAWNGLFWGVTGVLAAFPLNWLSRRYGKKNALLIAIGLMVGAQLAKLFCYSPSVPEIVFVPTILLSAGMFMFFTVAASMIGDICDADELATGTRSEGSYFSVFWWFIKMGSALAGFVMGALVTFTDFDEQQNKLVNELRTSIDNVRVEVNRVADDSDSAGLDVGLLKKQLAAMTASTQELQDHWSQTQHDSNSLPGHRATLLQKLSRFRSDVEDLLSQLAGNTTDLAELRDRADRLFDHTVGLKQQAPQTIWWLWTVEIAVPIALSAVSIFLALQYPLTEARCYEIQAALAARNGNQKDS